MRWFARRLTAVMTVAFMAMAVAMLATPGISSAECDHNMSFNPATLECKPPPAVSAWYTPPPPYAPSFAGQDVPPPPPVRPPWAPQAPMWSTQYHQWGFYVGGVWVPL
ncbi:hypothetical protein [Mycobacterium sp. E2733]|uniref:hypothetical protein n=1 Tax=Mycobacterium sp. E2733 TaxID=1834138 RepID=UPI0007FD9F14|nr:hypothetical protein [Mycobacterium sp. E2733]OBH99089.1 hypothetical protein A5678_20745 [Mycobacterium sp. E2733]